MWSRCDDATKKKERSFLPLIKEKKNGLVGFKFRFDITICHDDYVVDDLDDVNVDVKMRLTTYVAFICVCDDTHSHSHTQLFRTD